MRHSHIYMRFPEGRYKALTFSFDDGSDQDRWLCELMVSHGMKATFNVNMGLLPDREDFDFSSLDETIFPGKQYQHRLTADGIRRTFEGTGMELATHGYLHAELTRLEDDALVYEIIRDREALEKITRAPVRGHAYAQGSHNDRVCEVLPKAGIVYARTVNFTGGFSLPQDFMRWNPTCQYFEERAMELSSEFIQAKPGRCKYYPDTDAKLFYIFAHSYELDIRNDYNDMERLADKLAGHVDIWYCTNMEYYRYSEAFGRLDFNLERTRVYNPSAIPVWIFANDRIVEVPSGEIVDI